MVLNLKKLSINGKNRKKQIITITYGKFNDSNFHKILYAHVKHIFGGLWGENGGHKMFLERNEY